MKFIHAPLARPNRTAAALAAAVALPLLFPPFSVAQPDDAASTLAALIDEVRQNDPTIKAARHRWEALREEAPAARGLPDPELTAGYYLSSVETRVGPQEAKFGLVQEIPFPGKLKLAEERALSEAEEAYWSYLRLMRDRATQAKRLYAELYRIDATRSFVEDQVPLLDEQVESLNRQYETGQAALDELHLARQRRSALKARLADLEGQRPATLAQINRLRGAGRDAAFPEVLALPHPPLADAERLAALAEANSEWLQAERAAVESDRTGVAIARKNRLPDVTVGIEYTNVDRNRFSSPPDNGDDAALAYVRFNLPLWKGKYDAREAGARARLEASEARREAARQDLLAAIERERARVAAFDEQIALYRRELLPEAEARHEASLAAYAAGKATALHWVESQRDLLQAQTGLVLLQAERYAAIAALEGLAAANLSSL